MKLLLTSVGWRKNPQIGKEFLKLVGKKPSEIKIFLVVTPIKYLKRNKHILGQLRKIRVPEKNITFFKLDRRAKKEDLKNIDVIFVFGGNTFEYLYRIKKTGLDKLIKSFVKRGGVYFGISAGSYVACSTIEAATWKHADKKFLDKNFLKLKNLKGLKLVPFLIAVHFEEKFRSIIEKAAENTKRQVIAITDKQAVLVKGKSKKIIGKGKKNIFNI